MDIALSILALIAGGLALELFAAPRPVLEFHERKMFRLRADAADLAEELQIGNPS